VPGEWFPRLLERHQAGVRREDRVTLAVVAEASPAILISPDHRRAASSASRVLPQPAGPVRRASRPTASGTPGWGQLLLPADEAGRRPWQLGICVSIRNEQGGEPHGSGGSSPRHN
jgi:hypothetical protein